MSRKDKLPSPLSELIRLRIELGGRDMGTGRGYDYNHASSNQNAVVIVILIIAAICILGGLTLGLNVLDHI